MQANIEKQAGCSIPPVPENAAVDQPGVREALGTIPPAAIGGILAFIRVRQDTLSDSAPAGNRISPLAGIYCASDGTPSSCEVQGQMEVLSEDWANAVEDARRLARQYPRLFEFDENTANAV
jgi:hypothetical protein